MITFGGMDIFSSGPARVCSSKLHRRSDRRKLAGLNGELALDMGLASRTIEQTGRLQAETFSDLHDQIEAIESLMDGTDRTFVAPGGRAYPSCVIETFELTEGPRRGRGYWAEYRIVYRELRP